jgi:catecholate siderophore receptor
LEDDHDETPGDTPPGRRFQLNIENLFNTGYWATADGNNNISPGQGRTIRVSARAQF